MIEHSHLKIIQALNINGTLTEAANSLCLSQSALSHQIRYLEKKLNLALWQRDGRCLRLTQAGRLLLQTAEQILPVLAQTEKTLKAYSEGRQGILRIGVECYPCYEWLTGVVGTFLQAMPDVEIDIVNKFQFTGLEGLLNHHIDVLITPDPVRKKEIKYEPLAEYETVLVVSASHPLASVKILKPEHLINETLLTFPVPQDRLDILTQFLKPAQVKPEKLKEIESIDLMLQLASLQRGVCVLPEWLAESYCKSLPLKIIRIGKTGIHKELLIALRKDDQQVPYIEQFIQIGRTIASKSF
ncbi:Transcriptional activator MetR [hydrothermal vent metagenome]|uniref:Transcriptional activator MetR n=1 Tax=hydrothermal vent metagenome TaxID=652676 RepID=A0A3B0WPP6_9ZZZZ